MKPQAEGRRLTASEFAALPDDDRRDEFEAGCRLVWVVDPARRSVTTYRSVLDPRVLGADDVLACEDIIPGLNARVSSIFQSDPTA